MAVKEITATKLDPNAAGEITFVSAAKDDVLEFDYSGAGDNKLLILINNESTITFKKGDSIQGVVDVPVEITASAAISLESGLFKNVDGTTPEGAVNEDKGKVIAEVTADDGNSGGVEAALIQLP